MLATTAQRQIGRVVGTQKNIDVGRCSCGTLFPRPPGKKDPKETILQLNLKTRRLGDVLIVHCVGRIVYRDETAVFSRVVRQALQHTREVVLDLKSVHSVDSAGLGELVLLHLWATSQDKVLRLVGSNRRLLELFELTNLSSVMMTYSSLEEALQGSQPLAPSMSYANPGLDALDA
jgi:anti-sigma B factor antagonist